MDRTEALKTIAAEARHGELVFPTSVAAALRIGRALDDPECTTAAAARLIETEPLLSARVVALANSTAFNRAGQIVTDVGNAVARLGFRTVRTLAQALIARQMAGAPKAEAHREAAILLWQHTTLVSALARVIARRITLHDPDTALFAGLIHEVRGFYLISRADQFPSLLCGDVREEDEDFEAEIGNAVLERLDVPEPVLGAIRAVWKGYLADPPTTLGDTLLLAKHLAPIQSPLFEPPQGRGSGLRASIDMAFENETLSEILQECTDEVESVAAALRF